MFIYLLIRVLTHEASGHLQRRQDHTAAATETKTKTKTKTYQDKGMYEGWNFNSGNYLFTTDTK